MNDEDYLNSFKDYLRTLDNEQLGIFNLNFLLKESKSNQLFHDMMTLVSKELLYRKLKNKLPEKDSLFLSNYFNFPTSKDDNNEIDSSFKTYTNNSQYSRLVKWCPILLYLNRAYSIYSYLNSQGFDDEKIINFFYSDFEKCILLSDFLRNYYEYDNKNYEKFMSFVDELLDKLEQEKNQTESYNLYIDSMIEKNSSLLKRLA